MAVAQAWCGTGAHGKLRYAPRRLSQSGADATARPAEAVGVWYLAPFVPGCVLLVLGRYFQFHVPGRTLTWDHQIILMAAAVVALIFGIVWLLNAWGAERLQRRIDQLDSLRSGSLPHHGE